MDYFTQTCIVIGDRAVAPIYNEIFRYYEDFVLLDENAAPKIELISNKAIYAIEHMERRALGGTFSVLERTGQFCFDGDEVNTDVVAELLQLALRETKDSGVIAFQYAQSASRAAVDAYGGGAFRVTRRSIREINTSEIIAKFMRTK